jgi:hypothetical protein
MRILHVLVSLAGIAAFFLFLHSEYGSWSPNRIYGGAQKEASLLDLLTREGPERLWVMLRMLFAYWIDQRFGILVYAPVYFAFLPAVIWCVKTYRTRMIPLLALFAAHFVLLSWGAQMGGFAPPSRHFVVMIPMIALPILLVFDSWRRAQKILCIFLAAVGWLVSGLILSHYRLIFTNATWRNPDGYSEFWSWLRLEHLIPQLTTAQPVYVIASIWLVFIILLTLLLWPRKTVAQ